MHTCLLSLYLHHRLTRKYITIRALTNTNHMAITRKTIKKCLSLRNISHCKLHLKKQSMLKIYIGGRTGTKLYFNSQHVNDTIYKHSVFLVGYLERHQKTNNYLHEMSLL